MSDTAAPPFTLDAHAPAALDQVQIAEVDLSAGRARFRARLRLTPAGVLAIGVLVSSVLLSTSVLVWTATTVARRHPLATRLKRR